MTSVGKSPAYHAQVTTMKKLNADNDGNVNIQDLRKLDTDNDGKLSKKELDNTGITDKHVRSELLKKFDEAKNNGTLNVKVKVFDMNRWAQAADNAIQVNFFNPLVSRTSERAVINKVVDTNHDGKIDLKEVRAFNADPSKKAELLNLGKKSGENMQIIESAVRAFEIKEFANKGKDGSMVVVGKDKGKDEWGSYWEFSHSEEASVKSLKEMDLAMSKAAKSPATTEQFNKLAAGLEAEKLKLMAKVSGNPKILELVEKINSYETLGYINIVLKNHGPEVLAKVCEDLNRFMESPALKGKGSLVKDIFHDIAYPSNIDQGSVGTCSAAAIQMKLAIVDPVKYTTLCTRLAEGKQFTFGGGQIISPNKTYENDKTDTRSLSCKIIQNAFMAFSRPEGKGFDSRYSGDTAHEVKLTKQQLKKKELGDGMSSNDIEKLEKGLFNKKDYGVNIKQNVLGSYVVKNEKQQKWVDDLKDQMIAQIEDDLARGKPVTISFKNHTVVVIGMDKEKSPPTVTLNSWGKQYEMTIENLRNVIDDVSYNKDTPSKVFNDKNQVQGKVRLGQ